MGRWFPPTSISPLVIQGKRVSTLSQTLQPQILLGEVEIEWFYTDPLGFSRLIQTPTFNRSQTVESKRRRLWFPYIRERKHLST